VAKESRIRIRMPVCACFSGIASNARALLATAAPGQPRRDAADASTFQVPNKADTQNDSTLAQSLLFAVQEFITTSSSLHPENFVSFSSDPINFFLFLSSPGCWSRLGLWIRK
jgi:hypothetical protein